ncbi:Glycylpeptide N-tetradecanoyltransferase [Daldinia sp. FL1419]|nr:Glycylpeptide N-tetradecanoyltransferase [Daldinia sp. FL1419]
MAYRFWKTQPVPQLDDNSRNREGPIRDFTLEPIPAEPTHLAMGYEWATIDLEDDGELKELLDLLKHHYGDFWYRSRCNNIYYNFNFSAAFLAWKLKRLNRKRDWHIGIRESETRKLLACIFAVPEVVRVRDNSIRVADVSLLCVREEYRCRRLVPALIKELSRRCSRDGFYQALYTTETFLPTPISKASYYSRRLDSTVGTETMTPGLRLMRDEDVGSVYSLLARYTSKFELALEFTLDCFRNTFVDEQTSDSERVIWAYVVQDPETTSITDFVSFFSPGYTTFEDRQDTLRQAYLYLYASEMAFTGGSQGLRDRLQILINDALGLAKEAHFDVFSALSIYDNPLFLTELKFELERVRYFYLFNYDTPYIYGGMENTLTKSDAQFKGVIGYVPTIPFSLREILMYKDV